MGYRKRASQQYSRLAAVRNFSREFLRGEQQRRQLMIREISQKIRSAGKRALERYYEMIVGKKIPEVGPSEPKILISEDRAVALVPAGTMNKKVRGDPSLEKLRRGLAKIYRNRPKRRVKAKPPKYYERKADKNGAVRIGKSKYRAKYVVSAIKTLGEACYLYPPKEKESILILENEKGDRVFIAPLIT